MYVELDHKLVPRKIEDINRKDELPGRVKPQEQNEGRKRRKPHRFLVNKYDVKKDGIQNVIQVFERRKNEMKEDDAKKRVKYEERRGEKNAKMEEKENESDTKEYEPVIGPNEEVFYDHDWGIFSSVLACYNNHWVLKTSPDDWWNVIVRNVAQMIDDNGDKPNVRSFFVDHEGKKTIEIIVPSLVGIDYSWLFEQFSAGISKNIKTPGYVNLMKADFSTSSPDQLITTQIMLMSSVQKYFNFAFSTCCGIPGLEMNGSEEDWEKLVEKVDKLETLLEPILEDLRLEKWFGTAKGVVANMLDTYRGRPDKEWWGHILSWNATYGSGGRKWWDGWMPEFLMAGQAEKPKDFPSGVVSVPVHISDDRGPEDTGILVAGTVGFTVEEGGRAPVVAARQGWGLLLPRGSPIPPLLLAK